MEDLYIVIDEVGDGTFYGECPMISGCTSKGASLCEVQNNLLVQINKYLESNTNSKFEVKFNNITKLKNSIGSMSVLSFKRMKNIINLRNNAKKMGRFKKRKSSVVPKW